MTLPDLLAVLGALLIVAGVALFHIPAAFITAGVLLVVAGERASTARARAVIAERLKASRSSGR